MNQRKFELRVLLTLLAGTSVVDTTKAEVDELVEYVHGQPMSELHEDIAVATTVAHVMSESPQAVRAHELTAGTGLDKGRYAKLIDLFRGKHVIRTLAEVQEPVLH